MNDFDNSIESINLSENDSENNEKTINDKEIIDDDQATIVNYNSNNKYLKSINFNDFDISTPKEVLNIEEYLKIFNNVILKFSSQFEKNEIDYILSSDKIEDIIILISNIISQLTSENKKFHCLNEEAKNKQENYQKENDNYYKVIIKELHKLIYRMCNKKSIVKREDDVRQKKIKNLSKAKSMNDITSEKKNKEATVLLKPKDEEIEKLKEELKNNSELIFKLLLNISNHVEDLEKKNEENRKLRETLEKEVSEKEKVNRRSLSQKKSIVNLNQKIEEKNDKIKEKEEENIEIQKEKKLLLKKLENVKEEGKVKEDMKIDLLEKINTLSQNNKEKDELIRDYIDKINNLTKKEKETDKIHKSEIEKKNNEIEEKNNEIEKLRRKLKSMETKVHKTTSTTISEDEENNSEKETDSINIEVYEKLLNEENSERVPMIQDKLEKKCSLISTNICQYEKSNGEIFYHKNDSPRIIQLSCGHYFHKSCIETCISVERYYTGEITPGMNVKCPTCFEKAIINS